MSSIWRIARVAGFAFGLLAMAGGAGVADEAQPTSPQLPSIYVVAARQEAITETVLASGFVRPVEEVYVQPQVEGLAVESSDVEVGQIVRKGETMAVLSDASLKLQLSQLTASKAKAGAALAQGRAQLVEAQANADEAVRVRDRYKKLAESGTMATASSDQAESSARAALARVNSARQNVAVAKAEVAVAQSQIDDVNLRLARTRIKAPVSGVVSAKNIRIGAIASGAGNPLFTIIRDNRLELRADVSEEDLLKLDAGQSVSMTLPGQSRPVTGKVRLVDPTVDLTSRLGTVRVSFDDPDKVRAGMFVNARIVVQKKMAVVLPVSAVSVSASDATVLKVDNGSVRATSVTTGIEAGGRIEIVDGVKPGDEVVAKAGAFVRNGDRIHPVAMPANAEAAAGMAATLAN